MIWRVLVFGSGKLISVGTKSPQQAFGELKITCKILQNYNWIEKYKIIPNVRNIVGRFNLRKMDIEDVD